MTSKTFSKSLRNSLFFALSLFVLFNSSENTQAAQSVESFTKIRMSTTVHPAQTAESAESQKSKSTLRSSSKINSGTSSNKSHKNSSRLKHKLGDEFEISFTIKNESTSEVTAVPLGRTEIASPNNSSLDTLDGSKVSEAIKVTVTIKVLNPSQSFSLYYKVLKGGLLKAGEIKDLMPDAQGYYVTTLNIQNPMKDGHLVVTAFRKNQAGRKEGATSSFIWGAKEKGVDEVRQNSLDDANDYINNNTGYRTKETSTNNSSTPRKDGTLPKGTRF